VRAAGIPFLIGGSFLFLALGVAITIVLPWAQAPAPTELALAAKAAADANPAVAKGRRIYAREGCFYCHTQQVRAPEAGKGYILTPGDIGPESQEGDYAFQSPVFWGTERQGPDLTHMASRLRGAPPSAEEQRRCAAERQPVCVSAQQREIQLLHLKNPRAISAGSIMPSYAHLSDAELNALVDYLLTLK
jgi:cytochrome c oxidase cbb3-type subunit 2